MTTSHKIKKIDKLREGAEGRAKKVAKKFLHVIILVGIKHSGKSTQGKLIAKWLNAQFFDTDDLIAAQKGMSVREFYAMFGKEKFMLAEKDACEEVKKICEKKIVQKPQGAECGGQKIFFVVATGGGICENKEAVAILKKLGTIIFLQAKQKTAACRILCEADFNEKKIKNLPAFIAKENPQSQKDVKKIFCKFYKNRTREYKKIADVIVKIKDCSAEKNAQRILRAAKIFPPQNA